ncbi:MULTISPECIES: LacI family DNA-binding transcriptional regulator [unclassified Azospirillum]|uniref:LacI family DNA-binding transcriptional regulator n=1 Tax=unclassified Azospirillum TaxID=2630922 RepID=UPI000B70A453|nr:MULTISPECIES: LacI family DNA-binding transcriptional regulator [unclassified Azospirillum]SNS67271.1 transcriptional regulator, LacI family [Azospirillum sp. RU38E]SNS85520.1 transcriptional regulator, LacI family [Azospirillum sp. RU37A]
MANIKDIAELAQVSIATVSRALSTPGAVRPPTLQKIEAAIAQLNYRPNMLAVGLRRRRSDNVIVAVPSIFNPFTSAFVQGIENVAREAGIRVLLGITDSDQALLDSYVGMIASKQADGMILLDKILPTAVLQTPPENPAPPIVLACEYPPGLSLPRVRIDNVEAAAMLVNHLVRQGHTRIAVITGPIDQNMSRDRLSGFLLGLKRAGLASDKAPIVHGDFTLQSGYDAVRQLLAAKAGFTGLCCANDEMALGAMAALREAGIAIPDGVSVVGFDNLRFGAFASPPLTTMEVPTVETGEAAMRLMLDMLRDPLDANREIILPYRLVVRQSSGPAPTAVKPGKAKKPRGQTS